MLVIQFIIGAVLGSFLFASYFRLSTGGNLFRPSRSHCDSCLVTIDWFDLIPIFSYLMLRGRCRQCGQTIPKAALASELFFASLLLYWRPTLISTLYLLAGSLLFFMAVSDARSLTFPVSFDYGLMLCAITEYTFFSRHYLMVFVIVLLWLGLQLFEPHFAWIGSGDLDVFLSLLVLLGLTPFAWLLLLSSLLALITSQINKQRRLPFIPFVAAAYLIVLLFT
ncbi:prepilin peptidase [Secundilactobacillus pentosiphilus]|uniref:Prepilin peptidase n=1 Tax=Secundilactobacillus pentosiphilus TaxID=1714682 RepID=A0A1Z5ITJ5_9LACO|nr:A24 family peptidase [Secundilactobacillus pentosiphilus]GAX05087.1 prepilin peptidase [Secundilactobacillus pentosiphilus]